MNLEDKMTVEKEVILHFSDISFQELFSFKIPKNQRRTQIIQMISAFCSAADHSQKKKSFCEIGMKEGRGGSRVVRKTGFKNLFPLGGIFFPIGFVFVNSKKKKFAAEAKKNISLGGGGGKSWFMRKQKHKQVFEIMKINFKPT